MKTIKNTDLSMFVSENCTECQTYVDMWKRWDCTDSAWIKEKGLIKHKNCSNIFKKYLDCTIHHSQK